MPMGLVKLILIIVGVEIIVALLDHVLTFHKGAVVILGIIATTILYFIPVDNVYALVAGIITVCIIFHGDGSDASSETMPYTERDSEEDREREKEEERLERIKQNNRLVRDGFANKLGKSELRELDDEPNSNLSRDTRDWLDEHRDEYDTDY